MIVHTTRLTPVVVVRVPRDLFWSRIMLRLLRHLRQMTKIESAISWSLHFFTIRSPDRHRVCQPAYNHLSNIVCNWGGPAICCCACFDTTTDNLRQQWLAYIDICNLPLWSTCWWWQWWGWGGYGKSVDACLLTDPEKFPVHLYCIMNVIMNAVAR